MSLQFSLHFQIFLVIFSSRFPSVLLTIRSKCVFIVRFLELFWKLIYLLLYIISFLCFILGGFHYVDFKFTVSFEYLANNYVLYIFTSEVFIFFCPCFFFFFGFLCIFLDLHILRYNTIVITPLIFLSDNSNLSVSFHHLF